MSETYGPPTKPEPAKILHLMKPPVGEHPTSDCPDYRAGMLVWILKDDVDGMIRSIMD